MSAWVAPSGLTLSATIIPDEGAPMGRTPDFENGPMIPETIFPIHVDGDLRRDDAIYDPEFDSDYPEIRITP